MTLQQLSYFVTACRFGNISKAAEEYGVTQPTVSGAIKNLEKEFGVNLIRRSQVGFVLTEEGEELRRLAESLIRHAKSVEKVMHSKGKKRSFLRLGVPPMVASVLFPAIYSGFSRKNENVDILTQEMGRDDLLSALDNGILDMAFLPHQKAFPTCYRSVPVMDFETVCCVPPNHKLAGNARITAKDLAGEPLVLFSKGFFHTERIYAYFAKEQVEPRVLHTSGQLSTVMRFVADGMAIGFVFRQLAEQSDQVIPISLEPKMESRISLVFHKDDLISDAMESFISYIVKNYSVQ